MQKRTLRTRSSWFLVVDRPLGPHRARYPSHHVLGPCLSHPDYHHGAALEGRARFDQLLAPQVVALGSCP